ncbi:beta-ribofuranosylaminobenzene 5'-phosphate synthase family protein [Thermococcus sp.]
MIIRTPKRLHLGLIDPAATLGRKFGAMGVALDGGYEVRIIPNNKLKIIANEEDTLTIKEVIKRMDTYFNTGTNYLIEVKNPIPRHIGLGSTTQLTLAVGSSLAKLNGISIPIDRLARILGRGKNGAVGIYSFAYGGFIIDGGVKGGIPPLIFREKFPTEWRFLLIIPEVKAGLDEKEEKPIMEQIEGSGDTAMEISHRVLLGLLPALKERNIEEFGSHLNAIQRLVGKHFKPYQGGEFREDVKLAIEFLAEKTYGCGQSSWGPTVYGLILKAEAQRLLAEAHDYMKDHGIKAKIEIGIPRNHGADIIGENTFLQRIINHVTGE